MERPNKSKAAFTATMRVAMATAAIERPRQLDSKRRFYRPELDVLRFLAFFMVLIAHVIPETQVKWIFAIRFACTFGVPVFFALSAYLITELLFREKDSTGGVQWRAFYIRRVVRIWPLYFAALIAVFSLSRLVPGSSAVSPREVLSYVFLGGNWYSMYHQGLPFGGSVLWSLCVEEQFYLVWPVLVGLGSRTTVLCMSGALWIISQVTVISLCMRAASQSFMWQNTLVQMQYLCLGAAISIVLRGLIPQFGTLSRGVMTLVALLLLASLYSATHVSLYLTYLTMNLVIVVAMLAILGTSLAHWPDGLLFLGKISYGLYVFHLAILFSIGYVAEHEWHMGHGVFAVKFLLGLPLTILVAALSYRYYETPFLMLKERFEVIRTRPA